MIERECKIPVPDRARLAALLAALGATRHGEACEHNIVFDDAEGRLRRDGMVLRLRTHEGEPGGLLTVKRPAGGGAFKAREELETGVLDPASTAAALEALGYRPARRYEKRRDLWTWRDCPVALDDCPGLGAFIEVEGTDDAIRAVLADLGVDPAGHVPENYLALWERWLAERGAAPRDMTFAEAAALQSREG